MDLGYYARALNKMNEPPFPVLVDALEGFCKKLNHACGTERLNWDPPGWRGPVWEKPGAEADHDGCYHCGAWWRVGCKEIIWVGIYLTWTYYNSSQKRGKSEVECENDSDYKGRIEIWIGEKEQGQEKEKLQKELTFREFQMILSDEMPGRLARWIQDGCEGEMPKVSD